VDDFITTSNGLRHGIRYYVNRAKKLFIVFYQKKVSDGDRGGPMWIENDSEGTLIYKSAFVNVCFPDSRTP